MNFLVQTTKNTLINLLKQLIKIIITAIYKVLKKINKPIQYGYLLNDWFLTGTGPGIAYANLYK